MSTVYKEAEAARGGLGVRGRFSCPRRRRRGLAGSEAKITNCNCIRAPALAGTNGDGTPENGDGTPESDRGVSSPFTSGDFASGLAIVCFDSEALTGLG